MIIIIFTITILCAQAKGGLVVEELQEDSQKTQQGEKVFVFQK